MFRTALGLSSVAILLASAGCNMCSHPYDNSGPVYSQDGCQSSPHARAGSILAGDSQPTSSPAAPQTPIQEKSVPSVSARPKTQGQSVSFDTVGGRVQNRVKGPSQTGDVPGSERVVSVTDRVVKPADDSSQVAEESSPESSESSKPLPSSGWTARRPTPEVLR
jgi:hypothetical protein